MGIMTQNVPKIQLTRHQDNPSLLEPFYSLTRVIRESLRLHNVRREKKRKLRKRLKMAKGDSRYLQVGSTQRLRSKSMDHDLIETESESINEISEIGYSEIVVRDFGQTLATSTDVSGMALNEDARKKLEERIKAVENQHIRRLSSSIGENELEHLKELASDKSECSRKLAKKLPPRRQFSVPETQRKQDRPSSHDDSEIYRRDGINSLRQRFFRLMDRFRNMTLEHKSNDSLHDIQENKTN